MTSDLTVSAARPTAPPEPLVRAIMDDDAVALQALLDQGMDPYTVRPLGNLDLMSTVIGRRQSNPAVRKVVMGAQIDPTRMGTPGVHTPWHIAARLRDTTAIKAMAKLCTRHGKPPNVNATDKGGNTPLGLALLRPLGVRKPTFDKVHASVQALLDAGANVNVIDPVDHLPLYFEMVRRHTFLLKDQRSPMSHWTMLPLFLQHGLDPHAQDAKGNTLLHTLAKASAPLADLIAAGARLDVLNDQGQSVWDLLPATSIPALRQMLVAQERRVLNETIDPVLCETMTRPIRARSRL